jgi:hypothetical protein
VATAALLEVFTMVTLSTLISFWALMWMHVTALDLVWLDTIHPGNWLDKMKLQNVRLSKMKSLC